MQIIFSPAKLHFPCVPDSIYDKLALEHFELWVFNTFSVGEAKEERYDPAIFLPEILGSCPFCSKSFIRDAKNISI